jgi:tetratricopeptide (TPR) repeat protein
MSRPRLIGPLLALITLLVYLPAAYHGFSIFDDDDYVTNNHVVQNGLTWAGVKWAFTTGHASNWHPLTWLSHMTDCALFGLNPGAHHFVNVLFHAANVALLFVLLLRLTGLIWPSAFVAALFAWHPLHVESVAWIAERKDVLSTFFALLALLSYTKYAKENCRRSFWFALIFFALGLMSKPMLVTLPFVMLLLDFWPLQRFSLFAFRFPLFLRLVLEKWPFFLFTAVSCIVTFFAQHGGGAVVPLELVPLRYRLANAVTSYLDYFLKMLWPVNLAVLYPIAHLLRTQFFAATVFLIVVSCCVWKTRRTHPYLFVGWLWFLGTLVPVIGLVQVGGAAMADRYTYIPSIGLFLAVAFGFRDLAARFRFPPIAVVAAAILILGGCIFTTEHQLRFWRDSEMLFRHALAVTKDNDIAHLNLGVALEQQGKLTQALAEYREAARLMPGHYQVHNNLGNLLDNLGRPGEALAEYREAVRLNPKPPALHDGLGIVLVEFGRFDEAMNEFTNAARLDPTYPWPYFQMGKALLKQGRDAEAVGRLREALRIDPDNFQILAYTAQVLAADENPQIRDGKTALVYAIKANVLSDSTMPFVLDALGMAFAETGDFTNAQTCAQNALDLATAAQMKNTEQLRQRLELYKNHQPWRESFRSTNAPAKN